MEDRLERIEVKIDKIVDHIGSIDITLAKQQISLDDHIARTALLEKAMEPLTKDRNAIHGILKFLGLVFTIGTFTEAVIYIIKSI
jgi:hypothetical protein